MSVWENVWVYFISGLSFFGCKTETSFLNGLFRFKSSQTLWFTHATYQKLWVFKLPDAVRDEREGHKRQIKEDEASLCLVLAKIGILHWVGRLLKVMNMTCLSSAGAFSFSLMWGWSGRAGVRKDAVCETAGWEPVFFFLFTADRGSLCSPTAFYEIGEISPGFSFPCKFFH